MERIINSSPKYCGINEVVVASNTAGAIRDETCESRYLTSDRLEERGEEGRIGDRERDTIYTI
jgi:hypothetical protein